MRLLVIARCPPYPLHLGDRLILGNLLPILARRGYAIDLIAFSDRTEDRAEITHYRSDYASVHLIPDPRRSAVDYLKRLVVPGTFFPQRAAQCWSPQMGRAVEERLASADVVHLFGGIQVYEYRDLIRSKPHLIVPYESYSLYLESALREVRSPREKMLTRLRLALTRRYEGRMFNGFQRVVVLTAQDRAALARLSRRRQQNWIVIPNGIALERFPLSQSPLDHREPRLIFVGNYAYAPNEDAALFLGREAFPRVRKKHPDCQLRLVGNAPTPAMLNLAAAAGITVTGFVPDVNAELQLARLLAAPIRFGAGMKNKLLEGMAAGLPIITTEAGIAGMEGSAGITIVDPDPAAFAAAVSRALDDPAGLAFWGKANRAFTEERFTWARIADEYEALYHQICHEYSS